MKLSVSFEKTLVQDILRQSSYDSTQDRLGMMVTSSSDHLAGQGFPLSIPLTMCASIGANKWAWQLTNLDMGSIVIEDFGLLISVSLSCTCWVESFRIGRSYVAGASPLWSGRNSFEMVPKKSAMSSNNSFSPRCGLIFLGSKAGGLSARLNDFKALYGIAWDPSALSFSHSFT